MELLPPNAQAGAILSRRGAAAGQPKAIRLIPGAKKSRLGEAAGARTANRHRWAMVRTIRWTGDPSLRNSAKWSRNFGRRDALWGGLIRIALGGRSEQAQATV